VTTTALCLVLAAAVLHAIWNIAAKRVGEDGYLFVWWYNLFSTVLGVPIAVVLLARAGWPLEWPLLYAPVISALIHIVYQLTLQTGYARADLNVVYPVARGTGPLLTMLVAIAFLGERPGIGAVIGGLVVIAGIVVVATGKRAPTGSSADGRAGAAHPGAASGLLWGTATGIGIAGYTLWDDHSVAELALLTIVYFAFTVAWQTALLTPGAFRRGRQGKALGILRRHRREIAIVAVLSPLAYILVLEAMRTVPVSLVAPAREASIVVGSLLAWWLFKEPHPARRLVGAAIVLAGIALIVG
jgi:drug/metabolite transporter (DMT)-like permease